MFYQKMTIKSLVKERLTFTTYAISAIYARWFNLLSIGNHAIVSTIWD